MIQFYLLNNLGTFRPTSEHFRVRSLLLLLSFLFVCGTASYAQDSSGFSSPSDACLAFKSGLSLGAPLPYTKAKLHAGETLTIVALGSSVDGTDPTTTSSSVPGLAIDHAGTSGACFGCHQLLDPTRSILSATYSWFYYPQTDPKPRLVLMR